jgi:hypothetical protein
VCATRRRHRGRRWGSFPLHALPKLDDTSGASNHIPPLLLLPPSFISLSNLRPRSSEGMPPHRSGLVALFTCASTAEGARVCHGGDDDGERRMEGLVGFSVGEGHDWDGQRCLFEDVRRGPRETYVTRPISITNDLVPIISAPPFESPTNAFPTPHRPFTASLRISYTPLPPASGACVLRAAIETGQEYNG